MSRRRRRRSSTNRTGAAAVPAAAATSSNPITADRAAHAERVSTSLGNLSKLIGADGYRNAAAFLGDDSPLLASGTFARSNLTQNVELLTSMYRSNWLCKRIIDMPAEDMTRAWYQLSADVPEDDRKDLVNLEAKHSVEQELANAIRWARLYGGSLAIMIIRGDEEKLDQPLDLDMLLPGCFQGLLVVDRAQGISPSNELESDVDDPDFGLPMYYDVNVDVPGFSSVIRVHHTRCLRFIGRELPRMESIAENYWGASEMEHIYEELQKRCASSANIAQLIFQANITTLKMADFAEQLALGTDNQKANILSTIEHENRFRTSYGIQLLNADDSLENHPYTFSGLSDVYEQFMMDMAGAAEIPATKLFGRSPQGLQATGEADLKNYYESIAQMQARMLRPALRKLLPVMAISCWGEAPEDLDFVFEPLMTMTPEARADMVDKLSASVLKAYEIGLIDKDQALEELSLRGEPIGMWQSLKPRENKAPGKSRLSIPENNEVLGSEDPDDIDRIVKETLASLPADE